MRTREEIKRLIPVFYHTEGEKGTVQVLILEILLDIRDILKSQKQDKKQ